MLESSKVPEKARIQCEACKLAKLRGQTFKTNTKKAEYQPGELLALLDRSLMYMYQRLSEPSGHQKLGR